MRRCTYLLPIRRSLFSTDEAVEFAEYFDALTNAGCDVLVIDGSSTEILEQHHQIWSRSARHEKVDRRFGYLNDKVNGIHTGVELSPNEKIILADDDIRYTPDDLERVLRLLDDWEVVRPQNYLWPLPWWARVPIRVGIDLVLRPRYMTPVTVTVPFEPGPQDLGFPTLPTDIGWTQTLETRDARGRVLSDGVGFDFDALAQLCPGEPPSVQPGTAGRLAACVRDNGVHVVAVYQPADRYWRFQLTEAAIYALLSLGLIGASAWWLRHRIS